MNTENMLSHLREMQQKNSPEKWYASLDERKKAELEFHNRDRDESFNAHLPQDTFELLHGNRKYYSTVELSTHYINNWIKTKVPGLIFLDYACGNGKYAIQAAQNGAGLSIGLDISDVSVDNAAREAKKLGLNNTYFVQGDCENTGLPDNSIDVIICSGMLHHLDLNFAFPELQRILKPGGRILAVEALDYNPLIKLYRNLTPSMRTEWEKNHILSLKDLKHAQKYFRIGEVKFWHLTSIGAAYIKNESLKKTVVRACNLIDRALLSLPGIRLLAWQFSFELIKDTN